MRIRILVSLLLPVLLAACHAPAPDAESLQIVQVLKAQFDQPQSPLVVDPVSVEEGFAIAGWTQGGAGGRALLQRIDGQWQVVLCAGDALLHASTLAGTGMREATVTRLLAKVRAAEGALPEATRAQFALFTGIVPLGAAHDAAAGRHAAAAPPTLAISDAWARATPTGANVAAAYFTLRNGTAAPDALLSISSPASTRAELHRTITDQDMARMRPAGDVVIEPGQVVKAEPGGLHVMLLGLQKPLVAGEQLPLSLTFREAGTITVQVEVRSASGETLHDDARPADHSGHSGHAGP